MITQKLLAIVATSAAIALTAPSLSQQQPPVADNNQDEVINFNSQIGDQGYYKILRSEDKREVLNYVTKTYRLQHANPMEVLPYLRAAATLEKGTVSTAVLSDPNGTPTQWIQVNVPEFQLPYFDQLVASYDVPGFVSSSGDIKFSYRLRHRPATEVADFIRATGLSGDGKILGDDATNTIYVSDSPSDFERVFSQIQFYDVPIPQVEVDVLVVELLELDQTVLGLEWDAWKTSLGGGVTASYTSVRDAIGYMPELAGRARDATASIAVDATVFARFLNYLTDAGMARSHVRTKMNISNGQTGTLTSGTEIPEFNYNKPGWSPTIRLEETAPQGSPGRRRGEGISLNISPLVAEFSTRMLCTVELSTPAGVDALGHPIYSQQFLNSQLTVDADSTYPLGVLRRKLETKQRKGIPLLKEIPVIKYLFSVEKNIGRETEFYVFVTPRWSSPMRYATNAQRSARPLTAETLDDILRDNENLRIGAPDLEVLQQYLELTD